MKAVLCSHFGPMDDLSVSDIEPPALDRDEVQIRVSACAINYPDMLIVAGKHQMKPPLPFIPGGEVAGTIAAVGPGVTDLSPGDRVMAVTYLGGLAEYVNAPRQAVHSWPAGMPSECAAAFTGVYATAYHALKQRGQLQAGQTLLVLGAAGGVGLAAVQLGVAMGARVIAAASTDEKTGVARAYGAKATINYADRDLKDEVRSLTEGRGADVICDPVGGDLFDAALRCIAWNGRMLVVGFAAGRIPSLSAHITLLKGISVVGVNYGRFVEEQPREAAGNISELLAMYNATLLKPHVSRVFPMAEAATALESFNSRQVVGKVVVDIGSGQTASVPNTASC